MKKNPLKINIDKKYENSMKIFNENSFKTVYSFDFKLAKGKMISYGVFPGIYLINIEIHGFEINESDEGQYVKFKISIYFRIENGRDAINRVWQKFKENHILYWIIVHRTICRYRNSQKFGLEYHLLKFFR